MNTETEAKVAIVICNYNKKDYVLKCLDSVFRQTFRDFDVYVVDNASTDGSADTIRAQYGTQVTLIENTTNLGGSGGFNTGMRQALKRSYPYLFLLDNDVCLAETALEELHHNMEENTDIGFQGCKILKMDHPNMIQEFAAGIDYDNMVVNLRHGGEKDHKELQTIEDCDSLPACALLVRTELIRKIGLMPEDNFVSWDDIEWCVRCIRGGYRVVANGNALAWHKGSVTVATNTFGVYYAYRNKIEFFIRYMQTQNDTESVSTAAAQKRADAILTDLFRGLYACTYSGKYNRVKTMMDAFLDALSMKKGQAESWQIRPNDIVENHFDAILEKHDKLLIDANGFLENTKRILSHIQTYQKNAGREISVKLISSRSLTESEILEYTVQDSSAASEDDYTSITVCEHIFKTEDTAFNGILVDGWCNVIMNAEDLRYCRGYEDNYQFFKRCYEDRLVSLIMQYAGADK